MTKIARNALIVAVADYSDRKLKKLSAAKVDAERLAKVLRDPSVGGFLVEVASNVREGDLRRLLAQFFANRHSDDLLLVHFSCHGVKDERGELYLAAADTESDVRPRPASPQHGSAIRLGAAGPSGSLCSSTAASADRFRSGHAREQVNRSTFKTISAAAAEW